MRERCTEFMFENEGGVNFEAKAANGKIFEFSIGAKGKVIMKEVSIIDITNSERTEVSAVEVEDKKDVYSQLPSVSAGEYAQVLSVYTDEDGNKAVIPPGWTVSGVPSENVIWGKDMGLVIYYIPKDKVSGIDWKNKSEVNGLMETYDQLVWIPVNMLSASSTLDGIHFHEKFGRMNYQNEALSIECYYKVPLHYYYEPLVEELALQKESIDKYGGLYFTRYMISEDKQTGTPRSIKGAMPLRNMSLHIAKHVAAAMAKSEDFTSHLTYGAEYDTRIKWVIETGTVSKGEIVEFSACLGNYKNSNGYPNMLVETGSDGCVNNIYGFTGNVKEWTQELKNGGYSVTRGGDFKDYAQNTPVWSRHYDYGGIVHGNVGIRATFDIK